MSERLRVGSRVLYFSKRHERDIEAEVIEVDPRTGDVQLNIKKGQWLSADRVTQIMGAEGLQPCQPPPRTVSPSPTSRNEEPPSFNFLPTPQADAAAFPTGPAVLPALRIGDKVFLFSQSLTKDIPAHVVEVSADGSVMLDVKRGQWLNLSEQGERITRTYPPPPQLFRGDQVLYWSDKSVSDATVIEVDGVNGGVELSTQPGVKLSPRTQQRMLRVTREKARMAAKHAPAPRPSAEVPGTGRPTVNGGYAATPAPAPAPAPAKLGPDGKFSVGSQVKYYSASNGTWIDAVVQGVNDNGSYKLNVQPNADPCRVKSADGAGSQVQPVGTMLVGSSPKAAAKPKAKADAKKSEVPEALAGTILEDKPDVKWDDIAGLQVAKDQLMTAVVLPAKFPNMFSEERPPPRGILMYGPPGTGKTHLARACATASSSTFFQIKSSDIMSKFQGESEKAVSSLFEIAQERAPSIIFLDEVDSFFGKREKEGSGSEDKRAVKNTFLQCMETFTGKNTPDKSLLVLGATNIPWDLDEAFIRRFQAKIYIPPPDQEGRRYLIRQVLGKCHNSLGEADIDHLAESTRGYSGSDIKNLAQQALMKPVFELQSAKAFQRREVPKDGGVEIQWVPCPPSDPGAVQMRLLDVTEGEPYVRPVSNVDFTQALNEVKSSIQEGTCAKFEDWTQLYGSRA